MSVHTRLRLCYGVLGVNFVFWLVLASYFAFDYFAGREEYLILKVLLFLEPLAFLVWLIGVWKRVRVLYLLSLPFILGNAILSVTDQVGGYDLIALALNLIAFVALAAIWRPIMRRAAAGA